MTQSTDTAPRTVQLPAYLVAELEARQDAQPRLVAALRTALDGQGFELRPRRAVELHAADHAELQRLVELNPGLSEADVLGHALDALNELLAAEAATKPNFDEHGVLWSRRRGPRRPVGG